MDLGSLLNQDTSSLSIQTLHDLLKEPESSVKLERITNATFSFPSSLQESFEFFNVHVQLLLSIQYTDEAYGSRYADTVVIESLRTCVHGLAQKHGLVWLIQFPCHMTSTVWLWLHTTSDKTILMYLYGLFLSAWDNRQQDSRMDREQYAKGLVQFVKSKLISFMCHSWLMCWMTDEQEQDDLAKNVFIKELESILKQDKQRMVGYIQEFLSTLDHANIGLLSKQLDQPLAAIGITRPAFSKDDLLLGHASFLMLAQNLSHLEYPEITSITRIMEIQRRMRSPSFKNPLNNDISNKNLPNDAVRKVQLLRDGIKLWQIQYQQMLNNEFDMYLKDLVQRFYPNDKKIMLDIMLAFWTIRDPYKQHRTVILDALLNQLKEKGLYNRRSAPYYAFTQLFNTPVETSQTIGEFSSSITAKELNAASNNSNNNSKSNSTKTGADINISSVVNEYAHVALKQGCFETLVQLTPHADTLTKGWVADCLQEAMPQVVEAYIQYLATPQNNVLVNGKHLCQVLCNARIVSLGAYAVPTLLEALNEDAFMWLRRNSTEFIDLVQHYFDECSQLTKQLLVIRLLQNKPKVYMDQLLSLLRERSKSGQTWFLNHFMSPILSVAGDGKEGVAAQIFRQILKTNADFIWYLGCSLPLNGENTNDQDFKKLDIAKTHEILSIKHIGLVSMFHEMVRLGDSAKTERLVQMWFTLWTSENSIHVPVSWIMQCTGLYDEAPAVVKQMIERLMRMGIRTSIEQKTQGVAMENKDVPLSSSSTRSFVTNMIDLMVLADIPELDTVMDVFLRIYQEENEEGVVDDECVWSTVEILIQLVEELRLERVSARQVKKPMLQQLRRKQKELENKLYEGHGNRNRLKHTKKQLNRIKRKLHYMNMQVEQNHDDAMELEDQKQQYTLYPLTDKAKALLLLIQRALTFLMAMGSYVDGIEEIQTKRRIRNKLSEWPLLYEPLGMLKGLLQENDLMDDLNSTIDVYIQNLKRLNRMDLVEKAQRLLDYNSINSKVVS